MPSSAHDASPESLDPVASPRICQNCQAPLHGHYCSHCGQHDVDYVRSFRHLAEDVLENLFHFEGKFLVSVAWLLAKPGRLTSEFVAGRRASQLNPLRLYIFATVLFFLGVHLLNHGHLVDLDRGIMDEIPARLAANSAVLKTLTPAQQQAAVDEIAKLSEEQARDPKQIEEIVRRVRAGEAATGNAKSSGSKQVNINVRLAPADSNLGRELNRKLTSGEIKPSEMLDEIEHRVPTLLFLGMPVFALILKLLYLGKGRYYIEHLVFSLHLHTWAFLALMVGDGYTKLAGLFGSGLQTVIEWALLGWTVWYVLVAFRTVYGESWLKSGLRIALSGVLYGIALTILAIALLSITVAWLVAG